MPTSTTKDAAVFIAANGINLPTWHLGQRRELRGDKSNAILSISYVTACSGRQLGGPWGYSKASEIPAGATTCSRCAKLIRNQRSRDYAVEAVAEATKDAARGAVQPNHNRKTYP